MSPETAAFYLPSAGLVPIPTDFREKQGSITTRFFTVLFAHSSRPVALVVSNCVLALAEKTSDVTPLKRFNEPTRANRHSGTESCQEQGRFRRGPGELLHRWDYDNMTSVRPSRS